MPRDGSSIGNKSLLEQLKWDKTKYERLKQELLAAGTIVVGPGKGGSVRLAEGEEREFLTQLPLDGSDIPNSKLQAALDWTEARFSKVRARLLEKGVIAVPSGRGKHNCLYRVLSTDDSEDDEGAEAVNGVAQSEQGSYDSNGEIAVNDRAIHRSGHKKPRVFIGSSVEGLEIAEQIQLGLDYHAECTIWHQGVFGLSQGTLESLVKARDGFDFAVLVLTPDDLTDSRKSNKNSPRDNVIFELGLFMGALGRERTFIVYCRDKEIDLPTDLAGVTAAKFADRSDQNLWAALGPVCTEIKHAIRQQWG